MFRNLFIFLLLLLNSNLFAKDININQIIYNSIQENKTLLIFLHRDGCGYCESMITFTLDDDNVRPYIKDNFVMIQINVSEDDTITYKNFTGSGREFAKYVDYNFYPSSIFIDETKEVIDAEIGYIEEDEFYTMLRYINTDAYKSMDIDEFVQKESE
jgi:thioredoxin-related protein